MTPTEYVTGALRTECPYDPVRKRLATLPNLMWFVYQALERGIKIGQFQTNVKKALFYGKGPLMETSGSIPRLTGKKEEHAINLLLKDERALRLLHAYLGRLSEAAEAEEHLYQVLFEGTPVDEAYLKGEAGDGFWFHAVEADAMNWTFEDLFASNNAKLRARYLEKFSEEMAEDANRNLEAEKKAMVEAVQVVKNLGGIFLQGTSEDFRKNGLEA